MIPRLFSMVTSTLAAGALFAFVSCSDSDTAAPLSPGGPVEHPDVVLLDSAGAAIPAGSTTPYSPRTTCGGCHDVDRIANGFHFQQGRTDGTGRMVARSNFFGDGRRFILSDGMYGKW